MHRFLGKNLWKGAVGRLRREWEYNIKVDLGKLKL
jgi:hypothetical protein